MGDGVTVIGGAAAERAASVGRRAVASFVWAATSFAVSRGLQLLTTLVLTRILSPSEFGVVGVGLAIVAFSEVALDLGISAALIYEQARGINKRVRMAFTLNLLITALCTAIAVSGAPAVAASTGTDGEAPLLRAIFLYLLLRGAGQVHDAVLRRDMRFGRRAFVELARAGCRAAVSIGLALQGAGAWAMVLGLLAGEVLGTGILWTLVHIRPAVRLDASVTRTLLRYGGAALGIRVVAEFAQNVDYFVVGHRLGPAALGTYLIAFRLPELLLSNVYWIFSSIAFPAYSAARETDPGAFRPVVLRALTLLTIYGLPVGTGLAVVAHDATTVLFSSRWSGSATPMCLIALSMAVISVGYASGDVLPAVGRPGSLLKITIALTVLAVAGYVVAAPHGVTAVALAHLGWSLIVAGVRLHIANRMIRASMIDSLRALIPGVVIAGGAAAGALPVVLATTPGAAALLAEVAAGAAGGFAALLLVRPQAVHDVQHAVLAGMRNRGPVV